METGGDGSGDVGKINYGDGDGGIYRYFDFEARILGRNGDGNNDWQDEKSQNEHFPT